MAWTRQSTAAIVMAFSGKASPHVENGALAVIAMPFLSERSAMSSNSV